MYNRVDFVEMSTVEKSYCIDNINYVWPNTYISIYIFISINNTFMLVLLFLQKQGNDFFVSFRNRLSINLNHLGQKYILQRVLNVGYTESKWHLGCPYFFLCFLSPVRSEFSFRRETITSFLISISPPLWKFIYRYRKKKYPCHCTLIKKHDQLDLFSTILIKDSFPNQND